MAKIFKAIRFYLPECWPEGRAEQLRHALEEHGGLEAESLEVATHIITNSERFEGWHDIEGNKAIVTDTWVERSITLTKAQSTSIYSPDPLLLFSGVTACAAEDIPHNDVEVLTAGITALGGLWRYHLTTDCTHLFACSNTSSMYRTADGCRKDTSIKIVLPHWFDECIRLGRRNIDSSRFEWPDPPFLNGANNEETTRKSEKVDPLKKALFRTVAEKPDFDLATLPQRDIWHGKRVLLSKELEFSLHRRNAIEASIRNAGGVVVEVADDSAEHEADAVDSCDCFVTRLRSGKAYFKAARSRKTIGNLAWLFHVQSTGILSRPVDELLHYPIPRQPIDKFSSHVISITNYTGEGRDYLKKMIEAMGAKFTANMTATNTVIVAAYLKGAKTEKAMTWGLPVVNHLWLEDCFVRWRNLTTSLEKYINFPDNVNFSRHLAERSVPRVVEDPEELDREEAEDQEYLATVASEAQPAAGAQFDHTDKVAKANARQTSGLVHDTTSARSSPVKERAPVTPDTAAKLRSSPIRPVPSHKRKRTSADEEEDAGPGPSTVSLRSRKPADKSFDGALKELDDNMEVDDYPVSLSRRDVKAPRRLIKRASKVALEEEEDMEVDDPAPARAKPRKSTAKRTEEEPMEVVQEAPRKPTAVKRTSKPAPRKSALVEVVLDDGEEERDAGDKSIPAPNVDKETRDRPSRALTSKVIDADDEDTGKVDDAPVAGLFKGKLKPRRSAKGTEMPPPPRLKTSSPRHTVSVVVPSTPNAAGSIAEERGRDTPRPAKVSAQVPAASASSRAASPASTGRARRGAAEKATQRLHEEVMPDVMKHQQERKSKGRRRSLGNDISNTKKRGAEVASEEEEEPRVNKRSRLSASAKGKGREEEKPVQKEPAQKRILSGRKVVTEDADGDVVELSSKPTVKSETASQSKTAKGIRMMTTQVNLSADIIKVLQKLGVKITTRPSECTHLVVKQIVRTEKFLCALAAAPWILTEHWARDSAKAGKLLPESDYLVQDDATEKKYRFKLGAALERAKQLDGKLFEKMTFYVTPNVPVDIKLLKNIIVAFGGSISRQTPTPRVLEKDPKKYIISCPEDKNLCRPVIQAQYPIYSQELVLTAALKQEIEWDYEPFRLFQE